MCYVLIKKIIYTSDSNSIQVARIMHAGDAGENI